MTTIPSPDAVFSNTSFLVLFSYTCVVLIAMYPETALDDQVMTAFAAVQ